MKIKKMGMMAACFAVFGCLTCMSAAALEDGVYTGKMVTSYYNPDTGNVDDGGTANAALGEGMCRSATDETCLVEVDGNDVWVTVRLLLQSNCSNVALYTRSGYDSYSQVSYSITSEDAANDSIDYRIKVSEAGQKLQATMYVSPMGRDVLWYLYVDTSTLKSGSGDFVVSIDTTKKETAQSSSTTASSQSAASTSPQHSSSQSSSHTALSSSTASSAKLTTPAASTSSAAAASNNQQTTSTAAAGEESKAEENADAEEQETAEQDEAEAQEEETAAEEQNDAERPTARKTTTTRSSDADTEEQGSGNVTLVVVIVVVVLAAAGGVTYYVIRRRKKNKGNEG